MQLSRIIRLRPIGIFLAMLGVSVLSSGSRALARQADGTSESKLKQRAVSFNRDIRPILSDKCFHCHGPDEETREAGLRFDQRDSAMNVIEAGDLEGSEMILRITAEDEPGYQMPPEEAHKPLEQEEIELLKRWVEQGAPWAQFWAYEPPRQHAVPEAEGDTWSINWIDRMVLKRLTEEGLKPSPQADKVTLIRRLYFDLLGLPPTPQQVQNFVQDDSANAYEKQVDALLGSPHFGERMAMYWLDLVRYADTVGYHGDQDHNISPYRDWVIQAFNNNVPFDQFTREQLAGDLIADSSREQKIASGYNRLLQTTHEGGLQPKEYRAIYAADRVRNVSSVWMGATVGCAQCHDHKYDPYTSKDFYALSAFFADLDDEQHFKNGTNALPTRRSPEILVISEENQKLLDAARRKLGQQRRRIAALVKELKQLEAAQAKETTPEQSGDANAGSGSEQAATTADSDDPDQLKELKQKVEQANKELKSLEQQASEIESRGRWTMISKPLAEPREVRLLPRGNWLDESGPVVEPAVPEFMGELDVEGRASRLDLANWLTDADQASGQLTARVFVNRFWYLTMGVGISRSLDDFGGQGEPPVYPELLDNLALDFASDWNVKRMMKLLVMSQTYRQASTTSPEMERQDPYNQWFARQSRFRLPAEMIRDAALSIAGLLNVSEIGGSSVKPYQPAGYYRHLNFPTRKYHASRGSDQWRRGVYVHWQRMFLHPTLKALDAPTREECTAERPQSNTPLAALALLNDPSFVEAARVFATRVMTEAESDQFEDRLSFAFRWAVNREPEPAESKVLKSLFLDSLDDFQSDISAAEAFVEVGDTAVDSSLDPAVLAAWTEVARAILNLNEAITRN